MGLIGCFQPRISLGPCSSAKSMSLSFRALPSVLRDIQAQTIRTQERERERERDRERERERERRSLGAPGIARSKDATGGSCERERERAWTVPELHMASSQVEFLPLVFNSYDPHTGAGVCGSLRENVTRHRLLHPSQDFRPSKGQKVFAVCFAVVHVLC